MKYLIGVTVLVVSGCYSPSRTKDAVEAAGFKNVETHGPDFFTCSDDYEFATKFTATNGDGRKIIGVACCNFWFGCSLRF